MLPSPSHTRQTDRRATDFAVPLLFDHGRLHTDFTASGLFPMLLVGITGVISGTTISKEAPTLDTTGPASTDTMSAHYTPSAAPTRSADRPCALGQPLHAVAQQGALHAALSGSVMSILGERRQLDPLPPHIWSAAAQTLNSTVSWRLDWLDSATTLHESTGRWRDVAAARRSGALPVVLLGTSPTSGCGAREDVTNTSRRASAADFTEAERACDSSFGWARLFHDHPVSYTHLTLPTKRIV